MKGTSNSNPPSGSGSGGVGGALGWLKNAIKSASPTSTANHKHLSNASNTNGPGGMYQNSSPTSNASGGGIGGISSIIGGFSSNNTSPGTFDSVNDVNVLVTGLAQDFSAVLSAASNSSSAASAPPNATSNAAAGQTSSSEPSALPSTSAMTTTTATDVDGVPIPKQPQNDDGEHDPEYAKTLQELTARLDRIKALLYEERSAIGNKSPPGDRERSGSISSSISASISSSLSDAYQSIATLGTSAATPSNEDVAPVADNVLTALTQQNPSEAGQTDLLLNMIRHLPLLPFEARKSLSAIFNYLLVCGLDYVPSYIHSGYDEEDEGEANHQYADGNYPNPFLSISTSFESYVLERSDVILGLLVSGHDIGGRWQKLETMRQRRQSKDSGGSDCSGINTSNANPMIGTICVDITLLSGSMLRSSLRHAHIYQWVLADGNAERFVYPFLDVFVHNPNFDVSSDALETVRAIFTGTFGGAGGGDPTDGTPHPASNQLTQQLMESIAAEFLDRQYSPIIDVRLNKKCLSPKSAYITKRMSLQLLSTILLNRINYSVMIRYISSSQNLVTIMLLLRDPSPHITLDAFQVFKIFVANPNKPPEVTKILMDNRIKLMKYLEGLHKDREKVDEQYRDEKALVIATLEGLEMLVEEVEEGGGS